MTDAKAGPPSEDFMAGAMHECLARAIAWEGILLRSAKTRHAAVADMLSGVGAYKTGGRFNKPGAHHIVYASTDDETAAAEVRHYAQSKGWEKMLPRVLVGARARFSLVLDLTERTNNLARFGLEREELCSAEWEKIQDSGGEAITQVLGRLAFAVGFEAILAPSARLPRGENLNHFPKRVRADLGSRVSITNPQDWPIWN